MALTFLLHFLLMTQRFSFLTFGLMAGLLLGACERPQIRVYTAPKDQPVPESAPEAAPQVAAAEPAPERPHPPHPPLSWTLPAGWSEAERSQVSAAQFSVKTSAGEATVNVTPLPNLEGKEAMVVNMWREQMGQAPLEPAQLKSALSPIEVAGGQGQLFEITGSREGAPTRIVTAMLHRPDGSWFFKLAGSDAAVAEQKNAFLGFLKSVRIGAAAATSPAVPVATESVPPAAPVAPTPPVPAPAAAVPATPPAAPAAPAAPAPLAPVPTSQP